MNSYKYTIPPCHAMTTSNECTISAGENGRNSRISSVRTVRMKLIDLLLINFMRNRQRLARPTL
jgi:hypothetical protein